MKTRKILLVSLMTLLCVSLAMFIVACSKTTGGSYQFEKYEYNNGTSENGNWTDLKYPDTDMNVDGSVTTDEYGESFLSFTDVNGVNMKVYAHMGEEGVFFGFVSDDRSVYYHEEAEVFNNTSVEIQVAPADTATLNSNVMQLRLGANGYAEQWIGFKAQDQKYDYTRKYIPSMGAVLINGELNTSTCKGYSMELYLPYTSLNLSEKPESIVCAPSFNTKRSYTSGPRATWTMMLGCNLSEPATWYVVNDTGMTTYTSGFIANEAEKEYSQIGTGNEFYFFDYQSYDSFNLETTLTVNEFLGTENFPKFGLVSKSEEGLIAYYIDAAQRTGTNFGKVEAIQSTNAGTTWGWENAASTSLPNHWASEYIGKYESIKMNLVYLDGNLYMLMDGKLVNSERGNSAMADGAIPGFMTFNTAADFAQTSLETDEEAIREDMANILPQEMDIDGDLSDWDALTTVTENALHDQDETFTRNEWTVRSFLGSDGLYIAYDVNHLVQPRQLKWDDGWFKNTNVELYVGGGAALNQFALTSFGSGGYMDAVMTTTEMEDVQGKYYHTIAEIFIPMYNLEAYTGEEEITSVEVGFAFKTDDNEKVDAENGETMNGDNWWYFEGVPTTYQYTVTADGIQANTEPPAGQTVLTLDGDLSDWTAKGYTATSVGMKGDTAADAYKSATFYSVYTTDGLYIAADVYHDVYTYGQKDWFNNSNVEFFLMNKNGTAQQMYVYASGEGSWGKSASWIQAAGSQTTSEEAGQANYHTVVEILLPAASIPEYVTDGVVRVGLAWKTNGDGCTGSGAGYSTPTESWWVPYGTYPNDPKYMTYVNADGIHTAVEYENPDATFGKDSVTAQTPAITLDGALSDWSGVKALSVVGSGEFAGKSATFYAVLTTQGLYLAADVYHATFKADGDAWHTSTNLEFFVGYRTGGTPRQMYVSAYGGSDYAFATKSHDFIQCDSATTQSGSLYHTIVEVLIPMQNLNDYDVTIMNGTIRVGMAWKTPGDQINNGADGNGTSEYWLVQGTHQNNDHMCYVDSTGIYRWMDYGKTVNANITLDGDLTDWTGVSSLSVVGSGEAEGKSATFYGVMTDAGLYLAVDAHYAIHLFGQAEWHQNTNFEFFMGMGGAQKQLYVYATGANAFAASETYMQISSKTTGTEGAYHTVIEVFIPTANLIGVQDNTVRVGVAWKTNGDNCNNGAANSGGMDSYWVPVGTWPSNDDKAVVTTTGIYTK